MLTAMGMFRLGSLIRYIPVPIVIGFTSGIAVSSALSQLKDFFGIERHTRHHRGIGGEHASLTRIEPISSTALLEPLPPGVVAYSIYGSLFFAAVGKLEDLITPQSPPAKAMILDCTS